MIWAESPAGTRRLTRPADTQWHFQTRCPSRGTPHGDTGRAAGRWSSPLETGDPNLLPQLWQQGCSLPCPAPGSARFPGDGAGHAAGAAGVRKQPVCPELLFSRPHSRAQGSLVLCQATPAVTEHSSSPCPARSAGSKAGSSPSPCPGTHGTVMATEWHSPKTRASPSPRCRRAVLAPASSPSGCSMCAGEQQCPEPPGRMLPALERGVQPWGETRMNSRYTAAEPGSSLSPCETSTHRRGALHTWPETSWPPSRS